MKMREIMTVINEAVASSRLDALLALVVAWREDDPGFAGWTKRKAVIAKRILSFADVAQQFRAVNAPQLFRGYGLRRGERAKLRNGDLLIQPRASDLLQSWTTDETWAYEFAQGFADGIVICQPTTELDVFLNLAALPDDVDMEGEVLVLPKPIVLTMKNTWEIDDD
jgi:hypothetical protein